MKSLQDTILERLKLNKNSKIKSSIRPIDTSRKRISVLDEDERYILCGMFEYVSGNRSIQDADTGDPDEDARFERAVNSLKDDYQDEAEEIYIILDSTKDYTEIDNRLFTKEEIKIIDEVIFILESYVDDFSDESSTISSLREKIKNWE